MGNPQQDTIDRAAEKPTRVVLFEALKAPGLVEYIRSVAPGLDPNGVAMVAYSHWQSKPELQKCSVPSIVQAVAEAAKLGLTVDGELGHAYLVPFKGKAQMMVGFRGVAQLAYRSEKVTRIHADTICENDHFRHREGEEVIFEHERPRPGEPRGAITGAYATAHQAVGPLLVAVLDLDEIHARRAQSASWKSAKNSSPWTNHFPSMAEKSAVHKLGKLTPDPVLQEAILRDAAREDGREVAMDPEIVDLGEAEVVEDEKPAANACTECGAVDGTEHAPDCSRPGDGPPPPEEEA